MTASESTGAAPRRRRGPWFRLAALGLALVGCAALGEACLRVYVAARGWTPNCYAAQLELFRPNAENGYDLKPGFRLKSGRFEIGINSLGTRGREISARKPAGVKRIAIVGESAAFGYFVSDLQTAASQLERKLRIKLDEKIEVVNAGVPGYGLRQIVRRYRSEIAPLAPDIVIVYLGWNDLPSITSDDPNARRFEKLPIAPAWERKLGNSALYGFAAYRLRGPVRLAPAKLERTRPTPAGVQRFRADFDALAQAVRASGARMVVCSQAMAARKDVEPDLKALLGPIPNIVEAMIELGRLLRTELAEFASRTNAEFIDVYERIPATSEFLGDYVHLTDIGEVRLSGIWFDAIRRQLEQAGGRE